MEIEELTDEQLVNAEYWADLINNEEIVAGTMAMGYNSFDLWHDLICECDNRLILISDGD